jgi:hypothetical protein
MEGGGRRIFMYLVGGSEENIFGSMCGFFLNVSFSCLTLRHCSKILVLQYNLFLLLLLQIQCSKGNFQREKNKSRETSLANKTLELDHASSSSSSSSSSSCKYTVDNENSFFLGNFWVH